MPREVRKIKQLYTVHTASFDTATVRVGRLKSQEILLYFMDSYFTRELKHTNG